jgi:hypothetical protein
MRGKMLTYFKFLHISGIMPEYVKIIGYYITYSEYYAYYIFCS